MPGDATPQTQTHTLRVLRPSDNSKKPKHPTATSDDADCPTGRLRPSLNNVKGFKLRPRRRSKKPMNSSRVRETIQHSSSIHKIQNHNSYIHTITISKKIGLFPSNALTKTNLLSPCLIQNMWMSIIKTKCH
jgi:hypothetical protein